MPSLARSVPKPLKVPSLARSVPKRLKVPSLARSVPKPLKVPTIELYQRGGGATRLYEFRSRCSEVGAGAARWEQNVVKKRAVAARWGQPQRVWSSKEQVQRGLVKNNKF